MIFRCASPNSGAKIGLFCSLKAFGRLTYSVFGHHLLLVYFILTIDEPIRSEIDG